MHSENRKMPNMSIAGIIWTLNYKFKTAFENELLLVVWNKLIEYGLKQFSPIHLINLIYFTHFQRSGFSAMDQADWGSISSSWEHSINHSRPPPMPNF